jgi:hypothetical protein
MKAEWDFLSLVFSSSARLTERCDADQPTILLPDSPFWHMQMTQSTPDSPADETRRWQALGSYSISCGNGGASNAIYNCSHLGEITKEMSYCVTSTAWPESEMRRGYSIHCIEHSPVASSNVLMPREVLDRHQELFAHFAVRRTRPTSKLGLTVGGKSRTGSMVQCRHFLFLKPSPSVAAR